MTFETPVQRVPARPPRLALVFAGIVAVAGLLVWQPWSAGSAAVPGVTPSSSAASGQTNAADGPSASPTTSPTPLAYAPPRGLPILRDASFLLIPTVEQFRPRWSVVGVAELPGGEVRVTQLPMVLTSGYLEDRSAAEVCQIGRLRSAMVAVLPAGRLQLIGIAAPAGALDGPIDVTQIDTPQLTAFEVPVPSLGGSDAAVATARLFVRSDLFPWPAGVYRFLTESSDGMPQMLYACLLPPSLIDGT